MKTIIEGKTVFYSAIESLEIDTKRLTVVVNLISGNNLAIQCNDLDEAITQLDSLADNILMNATHR